MQVEMDGNLLIESDPPLVVRQVEVAAGELRAVVTATAGTTLRAPGGSRTLTAGRRRVVPSEPSRPAYQTT